jgi:hypothetical protein
MTDEHPKSETSHTLSPAGRHPDASRFPAEGILDKVKEAARSAIEDAKRARKEAVDRNAESARREDGE